MSGKLIVIEGVDASGKETQSRRLAEKLKERGYNVREISFPDYDSDSSALVKMYLSGAFGDKPEDVSPFAASLFYAADRYASFHSKWMRDWECGTIIICDRYVTSNMIHQAAKIDQEGEKDQFLDWLCDLEYTKLALPRPSKVFFLDMPPAMSARLMQERRNKFTGHSKKDIHESDSNYLEKSYQNSKYIAQKYQFIGIECTREGQLRNIDDIGDEILSCVLSDLEKE